MKKIKLFALVALSFLSSKSIGQISVQNTLAPNALVQNVLLGTGVVASNITYNGSAVNAQMPQGNVAFFNAASTTFPLSSGVLLTSGNASAAVGPNTSGSFSNNIPATPNVGSDPQLNAIAAGTPTNGAILEFDFIPSGDTISFRYLFASEEYPEFSPSSFNDAFGFFLTGTNPAGGNYTNTNIALIPGSGTAVTINNVGPGAGQNPTYYVSNLSGAAYGSAIQYDGSTVVLTAVAHVVCGQTYHIKLAISNVSDTGWDSGVFLEADSFGSEAVDIAVATVSGDTTIIENCTDAQFIFSRPQSQINDTLIINYSISGTATMGTDYNNLVNPVTFLPGEDTIILTINAVLDGLNEVPESIIITAQTVTECGDTITTTGTLFIIDGPELNIVEVDPTVYCAKDSVMSNVYVTNGFGPYTYQWSYLNQTNDTAYFPVSQNGSYNYFVTATDACGNTGTDTITVTMNQTLAIDTMITYMASACLPDGAVSGSGIGITGQPQYHWEGPNTGGPVQIDASVMQNLSAGWYVFSITDNVCSVTDSVYLDQEPPPVAQISPSSSSGCDPLTVNFTNGSQNATNYEWYFGNGQSAFVNDLSAQNQTYSSNASIMLIAIAGPCRDTAYANVSVVVCGCTDPNALNYNPLAVSDDGSCQYPVPTVVAPNIFTPNGDNENEFFELDVTNAVGMELLIVNRWGNIMYQGSGINPTPKWDGKDAPEGVYFYSYTIKGQVGQEVTGHGFVELIRGK